MIEASNRAVAFYECVPDTPSCGSKDPLGSRYVTLTSGGIKPEGAAHSGVFQTKAEALTAFDEVLRNFLANKTKAFIRSGVETKECQFGGPNGFGGFATSMRLSAH